jgi:glycosyltransferase involved in cell wall biosynthesis
MNQITIITISFNSEHHLEQTIQSVISQTYSNIEFIIIDGASTDGTLGIIKKYQSHIDYWISEPDNGIADAMNKGLKAATGDYILFLHSDDYLVDENILEAAVQHIDQEHDIFLFDIYFSDNGVKTLTRPRGLNWWMNFKTGVLHQSTICSKDLFDKIGEFDITYKITMDYDFFLRAYLSGNKSKYVDKPLAVMRKSGLSAQTDWPSLKERFAEERRLQTKNSADLFMRFVYLVYWSVYIPYRYLIHCFRKA